MPFRPSATKWCHVTWSTARHRKCFNIAAHARFCEQTIEAECARHGWSGVVALLPDRIHLLVEVPAGAARRAVVARLRAIATDVIRRAGVVPAAGSLWEDGGWCSVLTNGPAIEAVRRQVRERAAGARA